MRVAGTWTLLLLVGLAGCAADVGDGGGDSVDPGASADVHTTTSSPPQLDQVSSTGGKPQPDPWHPGQSTDDGDSSESAPAPAPTSTSDTPAPSSTSNGTASDPGGKPQPDPWRVVGSKPQPDPWNQATLGVLPGSTNGSTPH